MILQNVTCAASGVCHKTQKEEQTNKAEKLLGFFTCILYGCSRCNLCDLQTPNLVRLHSPWQDPEQVKTHKFYMKLCEDFLYFPSLLLDPLGTRVTLSMEMNTQHNHVASGTLCVILSLKLTYLMHSCFTVAYSFDSAKVQIQDHMHAGKFSDIAEISLAIEMWYLSWNLWYISYKETWIQNCFFLIYS